MTSPLISIILPIYNAERFLAETLDSLLAQSFDNFELIAVNDGSKDGSLAILKDYASKDSRIRIIDQENKGLIAALNCAILNAKCELLARADADDIYHPDRLRLQFDRMNDEPELVLLGTRTIRIDENGRTLYREFQPETKTEILQELLGGFGGVIPHPSAMYRKSQVIEMGMYRQEAKDCEDLDLWLRLSSIGEIANIPQNLLYYRVQSQAISTRLWREQAESSKRICLQWQKANNASCPQNTIWKRIGKHQSTASFAHARKAAKQGFYDSAVRLTWNGIKEEPTNLTGWKSLLKYSAKLFTLKNSRGKPTAE